MGVSRRTGQDGTDELYRTADNRNVAFLWHRFGSGASIRFCGMELIAAGVFLFQIAFCAIGLQCFPFGPLEWIWRMLTYGRRLPIKKE